MRKQSKNGSAQWAAKVSECGEKLKIENWKLENKITTASTGVQNLGVIHRWHRWTQMLN